MELSSRQIVALAAPLVVTYLTYATIERGSQMLKTVNAVKAATAAHRTTSGPAGAAATRDPFSPAPVGVEKSVSALAAALLGQADSEQAQEAVKKEAELPLRLDGTVITARWRFAILNGDRVVEGQVYNGLKVERIEAERIVLSGGGETIDVNLEIARAVSPAPMPAATAPGINGLSPLGPGAAPDILRALGIPRS